jgi:CheY-like chemotaxis protein
MAPPEGPRRVDVLIAQDDAPGRRDLRRLVEAWGFTCAEAGDGREALDLAVRQPPACVLLDLGAPLDGFAVARALRADPRTRAARIHCLGGRSDPRAPLRALEAGCERLLAKPVDPAELLDALRAPPPPAEAVRVGGLTLAQAEVLLDWLENHGCTALEAIPDGPLVAVRALWPQSPTP